MGRDLFYHGVVQTDYSTSDLSGNGSEKRQNLLKELRSLDKPFLKLFFLLFFGNEINSLKSLISSESVTLISFENFL